MRLIDRTAKDFLYQQVISFIEAQQQIGAIQAGDRLPSLRKLSLQLQISVPTVKQAYLELERRGLLCAKPQSGYYLVAQRAKTLQPRPLNWTASQPVTISHRNTIEQVYEGLHMPNTVPLGISNPVNSHPPDKTLARLMRSVISKVAERAVSYGPINGDPSLRLQLASRYREQGVAVNPDDIVITNGAQEALSIALQCVAKAGDVIAIESPCYFGIIELIESLGMRAIEVYTCPQQGICLDDLTKTLSQYPVAACVFSTAINNPLGSYMDNAQRQQLVALIEQFHVPLIEDDVYGELYFGEQRPLPAQLYSEQGLVLTCSSFSKTAAPGYRTGWLLPGKYEEQAKRLKRAQSCSTAMLQQWTLTEYILSGDYDRHLHRLRKILASNCERMRALITESFPEDICISKPQGGSVLWVRCRSAVDTTALFSRALAHGVSFAPGEIFSSQGQYRNFMRISFGVKWSGSVEQAVKVLGQLVAEQYAKLEQAAV